jgi:Tannase and feruloyl esterase
MEETLSFIRPSVLILSAAILSRPLFAQQPCDRLTALELPHTAITSATMVPAGPFKGPTAFGDPAKPVPVPAHCDVRGVSRPTSDSEIKFAVWLPAAGWNGNYRQEGNGGWAGAIQFEEMIDSLSRGFATAATDDGHEAELGSAAWATGHPEKLIDFGFRAVHETNLQARAIVRAFFGKDPARSYFVGCSDGGREALMEAQRYADDFDGIIAGAPANNWTRLFTGFVWNQQALLNDPASAIPAAKLPAIQKAALAACDTLDAVKDGLIEDPRACHFDPAILTCKGADGPDCLTAPQVTALKKIYAGPKNPRTGAQIFPGYTAGTEAASGAWMPWIMTPASPRGSLQSGFGNSFFGQVVFENPKWDFRKMDFDRDLALANEKTGWILNSTNPDLRSFRARGGKLIQYHGWGDAAIAPASSIEYYESVQAFLAKYPDARSNSSSPITDFYRLFMVPGMGHCGGGLGPNNFSGAPGRMDAEHDVFTALERWVEKGVAPEKLIGAGNQPQPMTRPLCVYPQVARYNGSGDPSQASSFSCAIPPPK